MAFSSAACAGSLVFGLGPTRSWAATVPVVRTARKPPAPAVARHAAMKRALFQSQCARMVLTPLSGRTNSIRAPRVLQVNTGTGSGYGIHDRARPKRDAAGRNSFLAVLLVPTVHQHQERVRASGQRRRAGRS